MFDDNGEGKELMKNNNKRTLAIIPCYNEQSTIGSIALETRRHVDEVLVIDDGSTDETARIAKEAGATVISHKVNEGKSSGIKKGFKYALANNFDYVITLDGDAQHNPNEIPLLLDSVKNNGHDIILGVRYGKDTEMPLWRKAGKRVLDYTTSFGNGGFVTDSQCGFRAFNRKAVQNLASRLNGNAFTVESEELIKAHEAGLQISSENITCKYKDLDTSTKNPTSHGLSVLSYVIWLVAKRRPLLFIGVPSFITFIIGMLLGLNTLKYYAQTHVFPVSSAFLVSLLLLIGIIGMFMAVMFNILPGITKQSNTENRM